jgi:antitoxin component YwqK of YwqJK toxin-antitoxin module
MAKKAYLKYHKDGTLWAKGSIDNGIFEDYFEWFRKDGTIMRSGYFKKGKQTGEWRTFDKKGDIVKTTNFD